QQESRSAPPWSTAVRSPRRVTRVSALSVCPSQRSGSRNCCARNSVERRSLCGRAHWLHEVRRSERSNAEVVPSMSMSMSMSTWTRCLHRCRWGTALEPCSCGESLRHERRALMRAKSLHASPQLNSAVSDARYRARDTIPLIHSRKDWTVGLDLWS
ncbi:MAG: hypothetical protein RL591_1909, partial [Planctomycetota bacterium]